MNLDEDTDDSKTDCTENQGNMFLLMWWRGKLGLIARV